MESPDWQPFLEAEETPAPGLPVPQAGFWVRNLIQATVLWKPY